MKKDHIDRVGIELYSRWKECRLGDLTKVITKGTTPSSLGGKFVDKGINYIKSESVSYDRKIDKSTFVFIDEEMHQKLKRSQLAVDDILYSMAGIFLGKNGLVTEDMLPANTNQAFAIIRLNQEKAKPKFIHYYLRQKSVIDFVNNMSGQSAQPNINFEEIKAIEVFLPPLPEQTAIATTLSSLDDKIDLLHRQNKTLEQLAETLFRQWFVEEAEESWEEKCFGDLVETTLGGEWGKENMEGEFNLQVQCIRGTDIADLKKGIPDKTPIRFIKRKKFDSIEIKDGDLIMEISGGTDNQSTGRTVYINSNIKALFKYSLVFSNFCRLIRPKKSEYSFFIYAYINHLYEQGDLFNLENGSSGIKNLNYKALLFELEYKMPNEKRIIQFHKEVERYFYKINKNKSQIRTLTQTRDNLLPKLMSGEVRVNL
jgi:type I restriction enzyme, S subunit